MSLRQCLLAILVLVCLTTAGRGQPPADAPARLPDRPAVATTDPQAELMETVGAFSGLYLYHAYLNIGLLADGKAERVYDEKAARAVLGTVTASLDAADKQLEKVQKLARTEADRRAAVRIRDIASLLKRQGRELTAFWDSGQPTDGAKYEATRKEAWRQLNDLLGLDKK